MKDLKKMESRLQKKELKTEITCFKITKNRKRQLKEIRQFYGKSYGFIVNDLIGRVYESMVNDNDTSLLKDASKLNDISKESLKVIKIGNKKSGKVLSRIVDKADIMLSEISKEEKRLSELKMNLIIKADEVLDMVDKLSFEIESLQNQGQIILKKQDEEPESVIKMFNVFVNNYLTELKEKLRGFASQKQLVT